MDIVRPPLHYFQEEIQLLPTGLEFLRNFLSNPRQYLKTGKLGIEDFYGV